MVEEIVRRTIWSVAVGYPDLRDGPGDLRFGPSLLSGGAVGGDWPQAFSAIPGHHVHTALVAASFGLAVACWRRASGGAAGWRLLALALPVLAWTMTVVDHAGWNAFATNGAFWVDDPAFPVPLRLAWELTGRGAGRAGLLVLALVLAMLVDAHRMYRHDAGRALDPDHPWTGLGWLSRVPPGVETWTRDLVARSAPAFIPFVRALGAFGTASCLWAGYTYRDLAVIWTTQGAQDAHGLRAGLSRWLAALASTRQAREQAQAGTLAPAPMPTDLLVPVDRAATAPVGRAPPARSPQPSRPVAPPPGG